MDKIAEILYEAYDMSGNRDINSENYQKEYQEVRSLLGENSRKLLDLECEFIETIRLCCIDTILFMLKLINPDCA